MKLQLTRPIVFIDIEATGLNLETDRIVEISICKLFPDGTREVKTKRYNPEMPIPPEVTEIHGINDEDVKDKPLFRQEAKGILSYIENCDVAGFNSNRYDVPLLFNEMIRAGLYLDYTKFKMIDVGNIFKIKEPRDLKAAYKFYCGGDLENAHSAEADITATVDVFLKQLEKYEDLPQDVGVLALMSNHGNPILDLSGKFTMDKGKIVFNFGPKRGQPAEEHPDFLEWMLYKASFPQDTREVATKLLEASMKEDLDDAEDLASCFDGSGFCQECNGFRGHIVGCSKM
jgi:DNA polymerase-3 subunit epsilon